MILASYGVYNIPSEWYHDSTLTDKDGNTVAMLLAINHVTNISEQWYHDPCL